MTVDITNFMTLRQIRRNRNIDKARAYVHAARAANPEHRSSCPADLDGRLYIDPARKEEMSLLDYAAAAKANYRAKRAQRAKR